MDAYETTIYHALLISGVFLVCLTGYFVLSVVRHQRKHAELQRRYFLDEIGLLEKERTRIARDLHDELAPILSLTKFQLHSLLPEGEKERIILQKTSGNLALVMLRLGEIAANLNASKLVQKGLKFALEDFVMEMEQHSLLTIKFVYSATQAIDPERSIHLYRIAQEIVQNTVKHSGATLLEIQVKEKKRRLLLFFRDNGKGFAAEEGMKPSKGIGLQSIRNRTGLLGGQLDFYSEPGEGTSYLISLII